MNQRRGRLRIRRWWIARTRRDQSTTSAMPTGPTFRKLDLRSASEDSEIGESICEPLVSKKPRQQISQAVSRQNHPSVSNPTRVNNVSRRKHRLRSDHRAVHRTTLRNPNPSTITVSNVRRDLVALFRPRLKVSARKFGRRRLQTFRGHAKENSFGNFSIA
jgi:hypothetical protein